MKKARPSVSPEKTDLSRFWSICLRPKEDCSPENTTWRKKIKFKLQTKKVKVEIEKIITPAKEEKTKKIAGNEKGSELRQDIVTGDWVWLPRAEPSAPMILVNSRIQDVTTPEDCSSVIRSNPVRKKTRSFIWMKRENGHSAFSLTNSRLFPRTAGTSQGRGLTFLCGSRLPWNRSYSGPL